MDAINSRATRAIRIQGGQVSIEVGTETIHMAVRKWGRKRQLLKCVEELNECASELMKVVNKDGWHRSDGRVQDEIADALIMILQMSYVFGEEKVSERVRFKLERLEGLVKGVSK